MSYQQDIFNLITRFAGQENILSVPRVFCEATGSLEAGMLLSQLLYWSDKGHDPDGWFYKSYVEWSEHLFLTEYQVRKFSKQFEEAGFLETKLKKVNGSPTLHYRVKKAEFSEWILKNSRIQTANFPKPDLKISESYNKETETTTEITNIEVDQGGDRAIADTPPPPPAVPQKELLVPNDGYDLRPRNGVPPSPNSGAPLPQMERTVSVKPKRGRPNASTLSPYVKGLKFTESDLVESGTGTNPVAIFYESYSIYEHKLSAPVEDRLVKRNLNLVEWRSVVAAWQDADHRPTYIKGMLDWYNNPSKYARKEVASDDNHGSAGAQRSDRPIAPEDYTMPAIQFYDDPDDPY